LTFLKSVQQMHPRIRQRATSVPKLQHAVRSPLSASVAAFVGVALLATGQFATAVDGTWTQATGGTQQWATAGNWLNGIIADGADGNAVFNVNLVADQAIQVGAGGRTIGNVFFRDTTISVPDGGFNLGVSGDGAVTLQVASGRALIGVSALSTGKKLSAVAPLVNSSGILKIGAGQLSIRANSPGLTGDFVAAGGLTDTRSFLTAITALQVVGGATFTLDFASNSGTNVTNLVNAAAPLTLGGQVAAPLADIPPSLPPIFNSQITGNATLTMTGKLASANSQSFASTTLGSGIHTVNITNGGAGSSATLNLGTISRSVAASVNFVPSGAGTSTVTTKTLNGSGTILGGWAIVGGNTWAVSASDGINPGAVSGLASFSNDIWGAGADTDVIAGIAGASGETNSVRFNTLAANTVTLTGASSIASGGILNTAAVGANLSTITGGSLTSGTNELVVHQTNNVANGTLRIESSLTDNGGAVALTKEGAGILTLAGASANTHTGVTTVASGVLQLGKTAGVDAIGGDLVITGSAALHLLAAEQIPNTATITFTGTSGDSVSIQTGQETVANVIVNPIAQTGQFIMRNNFTITGTGTVQNGILGVASAHVATVNAINMTTPNAIVRIAASGGASTLTVGAGGITAAGGEIQVKFNGNAWDGKLVLGGDFTATGNVSFTNAGYTGANVNAIDLTGDRVFNIAAGTTTTVQPDIIGVGGLTKTGGGNLTLTNLSTTSYTGATTVNAGTLLVNGAITGTSQVDIAGTLGGTGSVTPVSAGDVNLLAGGSLAPGASAGVLTVNLAGGAELDLTAGIAPASSAALKFELGAVGASDKIVVSGGALNIGAGLLGFGDFAFSTLAGFDPAGTYTLFDGSIPIVGTLGAATTGLVSGQMFEIQFADNNNDLVLAAVPEPGAATLGLASVALLSLRRRRASARC
jgi:autotransporter-associated beta strand protein